MDGLLEGLRAHADNVPNEAGEHIGAFVAALVTGFDSAGSGAPSQKDSSETSPLSSSGYGSETNPFRYESPQLIDFRGKQAACGATFNSGTNASSNYKRVDCQW